MWGEGTCATTLVSRELIWVSSGGEKPDIKFQQSWFLLRSLRKALSPASLLDLNRREISWRMFTWIYHLRSSWGGDLFQGRTDDTWRLFLLLRISDFPLSFSKEFFYFIFIFFTTQFFLFFYYSLFICSCFFNLFSFSYFRSVCFLLYFPLHFFPIPLF